MRFYNRFNSALGRLVEEITGEKYERKAYTDTSIITVPPFLQRIVRGVFGRKFRDGDEHKLGREDLILAACVEDESIMDIIGRYYISDEKAYDSMADSVCGEYLKGFSLDEKGTLKAKEFVHSLMVANAKEIKKRQLLVGSPLRHHNLSFGDHFVHADIPNYFLEQNWDWVPEAAQFFKAFTGLTRSYKYTLPIGTSQGFTLKTESDGPMWRTVSKGLLAALAKKTKSYNDFQKACTSIDGVFQSMGYAPIAKSYFLGLRRQHSVKEELVDDDELRHPNFNYSLDTSKGMQGRARGIFPPSEYAKAYYKPFSEGLKKALFHKTDICNVNQHFISSKLYFVTDQVLEHQIVEGSFGSSDGWYPFYDLSAYDTCTHKGASDIYHVFLQHAFEDFLKIEGEHFRDFDVIFPVGLVNSPMIAKQEIKGRSTQSGQSDVTVKNNIVHLLLASHCISMALSKSVDESVQAYKSMSPLDVFKQLISGNGKHAYMTAMMHGDDSAILFSYSKEDYKSFYDEMTKLGIKTGTEITGVYLKKTADVVGILNLQMDSAAKTSLMAGISACRGTIAQSFTDFTEIGEKLSSIVESAGYLKRINTQKKGQSKLFGVGSQSSSESSMKLQFSNDMIYLCDKILSLLASDSQKMGGGFTNQFIDKISALRSSVTSGKYLNNIEETLHDSGIADNGMRGLPGSLARNRFGEYGVKHMLLHIMALSDTRIMLPSYTFSGSVYLWEILALAGLFGALKADPVLSKRSDFDNKLVNHSLKEDLNLGKEIKLAEDTKLANETVRFFSDCFDSKRYGSISEMLMSADMRSGLLVLIGLFTSSAQVKASSLRGILDRLFYSNGEQFDNEELLEMYGSIQYDPEDLEERLGISSWSFDRLLEVILKHQEDILRTGQAPKEFGDLLTNNLSNILTKM